MTYPHGEPGAVLTLMEEELERKREMAQSTETVLGELTDLSMYSNYYPHNFYCENCGQVNHRYILKGVTVDSSSVKVTCSKCGCAITTKRSRVW